MARQVAGIVAAYLMISLLWVAFGMVMDRRTSGHDAALRAAVSKLWGAVLKQRALWVSDRDGRPYLLDSTAIDLDLKLDHRQKGLLWYSTYRVRFSSQYQISNEQKKSQIVFLTFALPSSGGIINNFHLRAGGIEVTDYTLEGASMRKELLLPPGTSQKIEISYESQGMDEWWYDFSAEGGRVNNFSFTMRTDFNEIDFPEGSVSPTEKRREGKGWILTWNYSNFLSGSRIGMILPQKVNLAPWLVKVSFTAPASLFLFFFVLYIFTILRNVKMHPVNYLFVGAGCFTFQLLLSYLVDHLSLPLSFLLASLVSLFLVVSYVRHLAGTRFALIETAISQLVYVIGFAYTLLFEGERGFAITILCIATLYIVMQATAKTDWERPFSRTALE